MVRVNILDIRWQGVPKPGWLSSCMPCSPWCQGKQRVKGEGGSERMGEGGDMAQVGQTWRSKIADGLESVKRNSDSDVGLNGGQVKQLKNWGDDGWTELEFGWWDAVPILQNMVIVHDYVNGESSFHEESFKLTSFGFQKPQFGCKPGCSSGEGKRPNHLARIDCVNVWRN